MILLLAGTKDGREIAEKLKRKGISTIISTVTNYGASLLNDSFIVHSGALNEQELIKFIIENKIECLIDATHPFAKNASINTINACKKTGIDYIRYERESVFDDSCIMVENYDEAVNKCMSFENIFLTIGSKNLGKFKVLLDMQKNLTARVLPLSSVIKICEEAGFTPKNIIGMEGPFTKELNYYMFKEKKAEVVVTKESGNTGGVVEKIEAAKMLNIPIIVIKRPAIDYPVIFSNIDNLVNEVSYRGYK